MAIPKHLAEKIASAKTSGGGNNLTDGEYILVVKRILCKDGYTGVRLIPECDVVEAMQTHATVLPNKAGSDVSFAWALNESGKKGDASRGNAKQFMAALLNIAGESDLFETVGKYAGEKETDEDSLRARGMLIHAKTVRKVIQSGENKGKEAAFPRFSYVDQTAEDIAKRRADLDARKR